LSEVEVSRLSVESVELELLDELSLFEQEMAVRLKRDMRIIFKILIISFYSTVMRGNKFEK
jgi:hypothetical protein|tara:strand:- start:185 stop:367 length:183 start_codon:yes stop_codon:yes gene_type:complete